MTWSKPVGAQVVFHWLALPQYEREQAQHVEVKGLFT